MAKYADGAIKTAKEKKMVLMVLEINGKYAKESSATVSGPVGPKTAKKLWKLWSEMADPVKRME